MIAAAFDLDGTLLRGNCSFSFCRYLRREGVLTSSDLLYCTSLYSRHLLFGLSLLMLHSRVFERLFQGKSIESLTVHVTSFIQTLEWYEPALSRLNRLREEGADIYILSGSPIFLVKPIAALIGVDKVMATDYKIDNTGCLWDMVSLVDGEKKRQIVHMIGKETIAFSDSHHDLPFLETAARAVAVNPTRRLSKIALLRKWEIL